MLSISPCCRAVRTRHPPPALTLPSLGGTGRGSLGGENPPSSATCRPPRLATNINVGVKCGIILHELMGVCCCQRRPFGTCLLVKSCHQTLDAAFTSLGSCPAATAVLSFAAGKGAIKAGWCAKNLASFQPVFYWTVSCMQGTHEFGYIKM
jgi:hypothetical protein